MSVFRCVDYIMFLAQMFCHHSCYLREQLDGRLKTFKNSVSPVNNRSLFLNRSELEAEVGVWVDVTPPSQRLYYPVKWRQVVITARALFQHPACFGFHFGKKKKIIIKEYVNKINQI